MDLRRVRRALVRRMPFLRHLRLLDPRRLGPTLKDPFVLLGGILRRRREPGLKVAIDANSLFEAPTGVGWYLANVLIGLAAEGKLVLRAYGPEIIGGPEAPEPQVALPAGVEHVIHRLDRRSMIPGHWVQKLSRPFWPLLVTLDRNDLVFAPNFLIRRDFRLLRKPLVATVHDLASRIVPETLQQETLANLAAGLDRALEVATTIVVPSEAVRQELIAATGRDPGSIRAIHHGAGHVLGEGQQPRRPEWAPPHFALVVGTIEPRKNLGVLLEAWELLTRREPTTPPLVVVGKLGWKSESILPALEAGIAAGRVIRPGYVALPELVALYRDCEMVLFPTLYEGFGLPVVEAFQAGRALIASDLPVLREVAGDGALFASARDPEAWAAAVTQLLADPTQRAALAQRGQARLTSFDWRRSALEHLEVLEAAARRPPT